MHLDAHDPFLPISQVAHSKAEPKHGIYLVAMSASPSRRWIALTVLSMGGGSIYILPYLSSYFYIPMKEVLRLTNTQLGLIGSVIGFTSMVFYWPGGWLADRYSPRKLLTFSFVVNGLLGLWLAAFPSFAALIALNCVMGTSLSFTYWSALIKATRQLGSPEEQGRFFGFLEGGRNLTAVAVVAASLGVFATSANHVSGLRWAIVVISLELFVMGILSWLFITDTQREQKTHEFHLKEEITKVVRIPAVWLVMVIILCAYATSAGITYITPYATDVYKQSVVFGGMLYTLTQWTGVVASPLAGFAADRTSTSKTTLWLFVLLAASLFLFVFVQGGPALFYLLLINSIVMGCAIYALRGIYYALLEESAIPVFLTGTATGLISLVAYTPDAFVPIVAGHLLDTFGAKGYKYFFLLLGLFTLIGVALTLVFRRYVKRPSI